MLDELSRKSAGVLERKKVSQQWLQQNYWDEWEQALEAYYCNRAPEKDQDGDDDSTQTSVHMPDTFAYVRRTCARITAQPPNIKFHAKDLLVRELISRTLMYQWDKAQVQRQQKMHVTQALIFGWSVRAWYWSIDDYVRRRRIDPALAMQDPEIGQQIGDTYGDKIEEKFGIPWDSIPPEARQTVIDWLMETFGKGDRLKVAYIAKAYEGPKCDFISVADCYPMPHFESVQSSEWFIVERRRNREWIEKMAKWLDAEGHTQEANRMQQIITDNPNGTPPWDYGNSNKDRANFRVRMVDAAGRSQFFEDNNLGSREGNKTATWVITEEHIPGSKASLTYSFEGASSRSQWIGEIPYPYDLGGKIAFTELVFIDNLLGGVGDSTARITRGLQELHSRNACVRMDLADAIARPFICTSDQELYEDAPEMLKRGKGLRILLTREGQQSIWGLNEAPAQAALATSMQDETGISRQLMMAYGDNNLSVAANVDPQQNRTATGSRIGAYNQDILTKDMNTMAQFGLTADAEMMFELDRSELTEPIEFEGNRYNRKYSVENDPMREEWMKATPDLFQADGEIVVEAGSTLADDDEAKQQQSMTLMQVFKGASNVNQDTLRDTVLIALGQGKNLQQWAQPPAQPPPFQPETKSTMTVSAKWEELTDDVRMGVLTSAHIQIQPPPQPGMPGAPPTPPGTSPPGPPPPMGPGIPGGAPQIPAPPPELGAYAASKGINPLAGGPQ